MNYKGLALISFILLILSLASVSASELDQTEVFESSIDDSIILDGPATDSSCDDSLALIMMCLSCNLKMVMGAFL